MSLAIVRELAVKLSALVDNKSMRDAGTSFDNLKKKISTTITAIKGFAAGWAAYRTIKSIAFGVRDVTDEISKLAAEIDIASRKTGFSAEYLQEVGLIAEKEGITFRSFTQAISEYQMKLAESLHGNKKAQEAFARLGIDAREALRNPEEGFVRLGDAMAELTDRGEQFRLMTAIVGEDESRPILNVFTLGSKEIERRREEIRRYGYTLGTYTREQAEKLYKSTILMNSALRGTKVVIANETMPAMSELRIAIAKLYTTFSKSGFAKKFGKEAVFWVELTEDVIKSMNALLEESDRIFSKLAENEFFKALITTMKLLVGYYEEQFFGLITFLTGKQIRESASGNAILKAFDWLAEGLAKINGFRSEVNESARGREYGLYDQSFWKGAPYMLPSSMLKSGKASTLAEVINITTNIDAKGTEMNASQLERATKRGTQSGIDAAKNRTSISSLAPSVAR